MSAEGRGKSILAGEYREIPLNQIDACKTPVRRVENWLLEELGLSIGADGLYAPIIVRTKPGGRFEVVAGSHRYATIQQKYHADREEALSMHRKVLPEIPLIPCLIRSLNDTEARLVSIAENVQRNDRLDPITEGEAFNQCVKEGWTPEQILKRIGKKQLPYVTNRMLLVTSLHESLKNKVRYGKLNVLDAVALAGLPLSKQIPEYHRKSKLKHATPTDPSEKCNHRCPRHCP